LSKPLDWLAAQSSLKRTGRQPKQTCAVLWLWRRTELSRKQNYPIRHARTGAYVPRPAACGCGSACPCPGGSSFPALVLHCMWRRRDVRRRAKLRPESSCAQRYTLSRIQGIQGDPSQSWKARRLTCRKQQPRKPEKEQGGMQGTPTPPCLPATVDLSGDSRAV
jgi:hypothetical protein